MAEIPVEPPIEDPAQAGPPERGLSCHRFSDPLAALGRAVNLLHKVEPFASMKMADLVSTLAGQVNRRHYLFAVKDRRIAGYIGWALCDEALGRAWVAGGRMPSYEECLDGDAFVLMTFHAESRAVSFRLIRQCRTLYPNRNAIFSRLYADGREGRFNEVFNRISEPGWRT